MNKEQFIALGFTEEQATKAATASAEELKVYIPKSRFDEVNESKKTLEIQVKERDTQLETLKNTTGDVEVLKTQIATLQTENKAKDDAHAAEIKQLKVDNAINAALTIAKAKNPKAAKALLDIDIEKVEFNDDGTIKGMDDQLKKLIESDDSKFLFDTTTNKQTFKGFKPGEKKDGTPGTLTKEQFNKMGYKEKVNLYNTNKDLYDSLTNQE